MWQTSDIGLQLFIQRVCTRLCNLNNNSVIHPETICAAIELLSFPFVPKAYIGIEKKQRQAPGYWSTRT